MLILSFLCISDNRILSIVQRNKTCNDVGKMTIDIEEDCKELLPFAKSYHKNVTTFKLEQETAYEKYPSGCYIHNNKSLYFNPHKIGKRQANSQPICKESKIINS